MNLYFHIYLLLPNLPYNYLFSGWCGEIRDVIFSDTGSVTVVYRVTVRATDGEVYLNHQNGYIYLYHIIVHMDYLVFFILCLVYIRLGLTVVYNYLPHPKGGTWTHF